MVTLVPFLIIAIVNMGILHALLKTHRQEFSIRSHSHKLRREFTLILLSVSLCFLCFNIPYYIVWILHTDIYRQRTFDKTDTFHRSQNSTDLMEREPFDNGSLFFTRAIFSVNYCTNFLLYCITGSYYRAAVKQICRCRKRDVGRSESTRSAQVSNLLTTMT